MMDMMERQELREMILPIRDDTMSRKNIPGYGLMVFPIDTDASVVENEEFNHKNRQETTIHFVSGKAEGHTETIKYYYRENKNKWEPTTKTVHDFKEGEPQTFLTQTKDGELEIYEFTTWMDGYDDSWYQATDCGHEYIWKK